MKQALKLFTDYIVQHGLKFTPQRHLIVRVFLEQKGHLSTEELYAKIHTADPSVGQATVYRTLKLLCESGIAEEVYFGDGVVRYEVAYGSEHHDHLICTSCGAKVEVLEAGIEALQEELASRNGFVLTSHHMYLYGICARCRAKGVTG